MPDKDPKNYEDLSNDEKALAHYLVEEGSLDDIPYATVKEILFDSWKQDQPKSIESQLKKSVLPQAD